MPFPTPRFSPSRTLALFALAIPLVAAAQAPALGQGARTPFGTPGVPLSATPAPHPAASPSEGASSPPSVPQTVRYLGSFNGRYVYSGGGVYYFTSKPVFIRKATPPLTDAAELPIPKLPPPLPAATRK